MAALAAVPLWAALLVAASCAVLASARACMSARHTVEWAWLGLGVFLTMAGLAIFGGLHSVG